LASYKLPKQVFEVQELPRNAANKLVRYELKKKLCKK
jgi:acyl-coenzyme A synthetase/AMP-(fatty) acid ligase